MTITATIPASGTIIATGATLTITNTIGESVDSITLNRSGTGGANEVIWTSGSGYDTPYTGSRTVDGADETFTFRRNAGWDASPFQIDVETTSTTEQLSFILVGEGEYPPDMQPFNDPIEGSGSGDQATAAAVIADNAVVRGDGGGRGVQSSAVTLDDSGNLTGVAQVNATSADISGDVTLRNTTAPGIVSNNRVKVWADTNENPSRLRWKDDSQDEHVIVDWSIAGTETIDASRYTGGSGSSVEVVDEFTSLTTGVTKFTFTGAGVQASEPVADSNEITVTIDGAAVPAANLSPIIETGTGVPNNDATVPAASPVILRDGGATLTPLSIERTGSEAGQDDAALKITTPDGGTPIVLSNATSGNEVVISESGITGQDGSAFTIDPGTATGVVGTTRIGGATSNAPSTKAGQMSVNGGTALGTTSDGGDVNIGGGNSLNGNFGDINIGSPYANEIVFKQGFTVETDATHPVSPAPGSGQFWVRASDHKPIYTDGLNDIDYDLSQGGGWPGGMGTLEYDDSATTASGIFTSQIRFNNADPNLATEVYTGDTTEQGTASVPAMLEELVGHGIYFTNSDNTSDGMFAVVNSYAEAAGVVTLGVTITNGSTLFTDGDSIQLNPVPRAIAAATTFIALTDVDEPDYTGHAGQYVRVNSVPDGLEFGTPAGAGDVTKTGASVAGRIATWENTGNGIQDSTVDIGAIATAQSTADAALPKAGGTMTGNITMAGAETVDGRDISADGTQLDTNTTELAALGLIDQGGLSFGAGVYLCADVAGANAGSGEFTVNNANPSSVTVIKIHGQGVYNTGSQAIMGSLQIGDWVVLHAANSTVIAGEPATAVYRIDSAVSTPAAGNNQYTVVNVTNNGSVFDLTLNYSLNVIRRAPYLEGLTDTAIASLTTNDILRWNGSDWANVAGTAANLAYDNATSGLTATDTQAAIDEIDGTVDTHTASTANPHNTTLANIGAGTHSQLETASVDSGTIFSSLQTGQIVDGGAFTQKTAIATTDKIILEETGGQKRWGIISDIPGFGQEANDLALDGINGIVDNQLAVGTGPGTAEYQTLPTGAVAFGGTTFTQAARADLSDASTIGAISSGVGVPGTPPVKVGDVYVDTSGPTVYIATGDTVAGDWTDVSTDLTGGGSGISTGTAAARPASPADGTFYYATDTQALSYYDVSAWEDVGVLTDGTTIEVDGVTGQLQVADNGITFDKMQTLADPSPENGWLLGRASAGEIQALDPVAARLILNVQEGATAGGGVDASTGAGAPGSIPGNEGDIYVDTTNDHTYIAVGAASSADWRRADNIATVANEAALPTPASSYTSQMRYAIAEKTLHYSNGTTWDRVLPVDGTSIEVDATNGLQLLGFDVALTDQVPKRNGSGDLEWVDASSLPGVYQDLTVTANISGVAASPVETTILALEQEFDHDQLKNHDPDQHRVILESTLVTRPAATGVSGQYHTATNENVFARSNGTTWDELALPVDDVTLEATASSGATPGDIHIKGFGAAADLTSPRKNAGAIEWVAGGGGGAVAGLGNFGANSTSAATTAGNGNINLGTFTAASVSDVRFGTETSDGLDVSDTLLAHLKDGSTIVLRAVDDETRVATYLCSADSTRPAPTTQTQVSVTYVDSTFTTFTANEDLEVAILTPVAVIVAPYRYWDDSITATTTLAYYPGAGDGGFNDFPSGQHMVHVSMDVTAISGATLTVTLRRDIANIHRTITTTTTGPISFYQVLDLPASNTINVGIQIDAGSCTISDFDMQVEACGATGWV